MKNSSLEDIIDKSSEDAEHINSLEDEVHNKENEKKKSSWSVDVGGEVSYGYETGRGYRRRNYNGSDVDESYWSKKYKDYYYPKSGAIKQARELFVVKSDLKKRLTCKDIKLLDIGFGVNSYEALGVKSANTLHVTALEQDLSIARVSSDIELIVGDIRGLVLALS